MAISIVDYELPYDSHNEYDVSFHGDRIHTLVTHCSSMVDSWLAQTNLQSRIVGLDVEWRPNFNRSMENPVATLQLCLHIRRRVGIGSDVEKLLIDYGLHVANAVDLAVFAADRFRSSELRNAGLKGLARQMLGKEVHKPNRITMSRWDNQWLTCDQVQYACVDAFLSFEIGRHLNV
ncbi:Werner Syndrome-like exonuclease [Prunus yedoensis var. nudiflora]|uniref:Werner Syndrome-like exonuclease n=1 Tax=Prunus yedoensis var. nudiflora TaxID=2094558 RepID=A0A314UX06_PRUYE|nr:Werner Syndrome-like exonuclease [Prunus yedoensis var. nudiflora]